ncbi:hypothetical protein GCM10017620_24880 [Brevundimonas intermedia]|uniref:DUF4760 domain-containing protein n=1 Tax=Brevundimonas intermedia TaxID=74315 RepID=A0ABQ5TBL2_9CAUL|nr:hypothetical protein [Brevundimonas intermedia]GLK49515.1 hypothetical protein GCM10017620_24880 [Brevundimonas intermedia]
MRWIVGIWAAFCAALLVLVWTTAFGAALNPMWAWFRLNKDAAGWVQAFGSIAAILATAAVVWWQETRRREDIRIERLLRRTDQLESLTAMSRRLVDLLSDVQNCHAYFDSRYVEAAFKDIAAALKEVPVHDARSYSVATAVMNLRRVSESSLPLLDWLSNYHLKVPYSAAWDMEADARFHAIGAGLDEANAALRVLEARLARVDAKLPPRERSVISTPWKA